MATQWIEQLAQDIKQKDHEAAEDFGRSQHYAGIIAERGKGFFIAFTQCLQENIDALRAQLQGDLTSSETALHTIKVDEIKVTRARFPSVDAHVLHRGETITLDYAKSLGLPGDPTLNRKITTFAFHVAPDDTLSIRDAFPESEAQPRSYAKPEDLARRVTEILFTP